MSVAKKAKKTRRVRNVRLWFARKAANRLSENYEVFRRKPRLFRDEYNDTEWTDNPSRTRTTYSDRNVIIDLCGEMVNKTLGLKLEPGQAIAVTLHPSSRPITGKKPSARRRR